jgi:formylmethanofuran dehydrogenase subunit C
VALAIALLVIVLIGALVTGTFFTGRLEMGSGRNSVYTVQATEAAETGITAAFAAWDPSWNDYGVYGDSVQGVISPIPGNASVRYTNTVRRMAGRTYLITSRGEKLDRTGNVMATRLIAMMGKVLIPWIDVEAAVTTSGTVKVNGSAVSIDGHDTAPATWTGCGPLTDAIGIRTAGVVQTSGSPTIAGSPPMRQNDTTVVDSVFLTPFASLQARATILTFSGNSIGPPVVAGSPAKCDASVATNWGQPKHDGTFVPCYNYFPIVYVAGNLQLNTGRGQGVLLVNGDLELKGNVEFYGLIIATGKVSTSTGSPTVYGAILSNHNDDEFKGNPAVTYSSCAVQRVLNTSGTAVVLKDRAWIQVNPR